MQERLRERVHVRDRLANVDEDVENLAVLEPVPEALVQEVDDASAWPS